MDEIDDVRPPDEIVQDQLIEDNRSDFEKQMDEAMYLSLSELSEQRTINHQYEEQLLKAYADETSRRTELFKDFLFNLHKISKFDKEVREIYDILDPIIESYCNQMIHICELDIETYNKIFNTLKKIRNNQAVIDLIKSVVLSE
jgi:hypothetical protein